MTTNTMRKIAARILSVTIIGILFVSCSTPPTANISPTIDSIPTKTIIPTKSATSTTTPVIEFTSTPTLLPDSTAFAEATIEAFGSLCVNPEETFRSEISPNGKWIAANCIGENGTEDSPLHVVSTDRSKDWKIYFRDYNHGSSYDHNDFLYTYRWSKDGRFLYASAKSRIEGCCWVGHTEILLIRLNLETGERTEFLNATDYSSTFPFDFIIPDSENFILFTAPTNQSYDLVIWNLQTGTTRTISLKLSKTIDLGYAVLSPDEDKMVLPLYEWHEELQDFTMDSIAVIDLKTNEERLLISGLSREKEFYPVRWLNNSQVLLNTVDPEHREYPVYSAEDWIVDINTGELVKSEKP